MADSSKVVIRSLPFEAEKKQVLDFFGISAEDLSLPTWPDSGRCKGVAFVDCSSQEEKERLKSFDGQTFEAKGNSRQVSISDYEERKPRKQKARRNRTQNQVKENVVEQEPQQFQHDDETSREVYVANVSFDATVEDFQKHFGSCGEIEEVTIPTLYSSGRPKGFAFVRFVSVDGRDKALELNGSSMINRNIGVRGNKGRVQNLEPREKKRSTGLSEKPPGCTTIYVGNLPWSMDEDGLLALFEEQDCGKIVDARIVRQSWTKRSRGFGYVEFENEEVVDFAVTLQLTADDRELRLDYAENFTQQ